MSRLRSIRIDDELWEKVGEKAKADNKSVSEVVRDLLIGYSGEGRVEKEVLPDFEPNPQRAKKHKAVKAPPVKSKAKKRGPPPLDASEALVEPPGATPASPPPLVRPPNYAPAPWKPRDFSKSAQSERAKSKGRAR